MLPDVHTPMDILVTGGAGFIGSHLVDRLVEAGHRVSVVDDLSTGRREQVNPGAAFYSVDITSPELSVAFEAAQPEAVFHTAAHASVIESVMDPLHDANVNVIGALNVLDQCAAHGVRRFVFSSTGGALYGEPDRLPVGESYPVRPLSPYGVSKAAAELYVDAVSRIAGMRATVLRYGNVYGPRQNPFGEAGVVAIFAQRMLHGGQPVIFGDGLHERDYVYVDDVIDANLRALEADGGVFNIGSGAGVTVRQVFDAVAAAAGYEGQPVYEDERLGDVRRVYLDASLAARELGWAARVPFAEGVRRTVASMRTGGDPTAGEGVRF